MHHDGGVTAKCMWWTMVGLSCGASRGSCRYLRALVLIVECAAAHLLQRKLAANTQEVHSLKSQQCVECATEETGDGSLCTYRTHSLLLYLLSVCHTLCYITAATPR